MLEVLSRPELADLVSPPPHVDTAGLRAEAAAIRPNLDELGADRAMGLISRGQMLAATERGTPGWPRSPPSWPRRPGRAHWPRSPAGRPPGPCGTAWTCPAGARSSAR